MRRQVRHESPALIPNQLWSNRLFTSSCLCVLFTWGAFNTIEQLLSLWMQIVQKVSPLQASIRFLPQTIVGLALNVVLGICVHRVSSSYIIIGSGMISVGAPVLMALSSPSWVYWDGVFPAMCLNVIGADCLYVVSNLVISSNFSSREQGLAGGVFNTVAQIGKSVGLALSAVVTEVAVSEGRMLEGGYKASFWLCTGFAGTSACVALAGLRKVGKIGGKND